MVGAGRNCPVGSTLYSAYRIQSFDIKLESYSWALLSACCFRCFMYVRPRYSRIYLSRPIDSFRLEDFEPCNNNILYSYLHSLYSLYPQYTSFIFCILCISQHSAHLVLTHHLQSHAPALTACSLLLFNLFVDAAISAVLSRVSHVRKHHRSDFGLDSWLNNCRLIAWQNIMQLGRPARCWFTLRHRCFYSTSHSPPRWRPATALDEYVRYPCHLGCR